MVAADDQKLANNPNSLLKMEPIFWVARKNLYMSILGDIIHDLNFVGFGTCR